MNENVKEVIIATNATLEGQTTGHYIVDLLSSFNVKTTRLAYGIPMGAELDYMDEGTLNLALKMRQDF
jgi:recombination protein RecR